MAGNHKYGIIIQARMSSERLPGKVLMDVEGKPMLERQLERLRSRIPDLPIIVATSDEKTDNPIEEFCKQTKTNVFRGAKQDVMLRFIKCANTNRIENVIRIGADDPLIDPECCLELIKQNNKIAMDFIYASNSDGWPYGTAAELLCIKTLEKIHNLCAINLFYLEHTTPYFFENLKKYSTLRLKAPIKLRNKKIFLSVDYPEDLEVVRSVFRYFIKNKKNVKCGEIIDFLLSRPDLVSLNQHLHQGFTR